VDVKALIFDTFGTVTDWRGSIIEEGNVWGRAEGISVDWRHFADRWRAGYLPSMDRVRNRDLPWMKLDDLHQHLLGEFFSGHDEHGDRCNADGTKRGDFAVVAEHISDLASKMGA